MKTNFIRPSFNTLAFRNEFEYRNTDFRVLNVSILAVFCAILMNTSPVIPEITRVTTAPLWMRRQKSA